MTAYWAAACVAAPLLAAIASLVWPRCRVPVTLLGISIVIVSALALAGIITDSGATSLALGGWNTPLGIAWRIDGLSVLMLLTVGAVGWPISLYARHYFAGTESAGARFFWPLWMLLLAALCALFLSNDLFHWYVTLELLSLSAVALVALAGNAAALRAAQRYLFASLAGSLCYLMGVALLYHAYGTLDLTLLRELTESTMTVWVALGLMLTGLLMKSAIFPLHFWLPPAHGSAPAPVSAILSSLVVKGAFYIVLRVWFDLVPAPPADMVLWLLGAFAATAVVWGSLKALTTPRLKMLVAYSTVAQLGYLALVFPLSRTVESAQIALSGAIYFMVAHACAKGAMFLAAGNLQHAAGHDQLARLAPTAQALPLTMFAFAVGGVSIMGLPPSGGFMAKWTLLNAAILSDAWYFVVLMVVGGLLAAAYIFRVVKLSFVLIDGASTGNPHGPIARSNEWASLALACLALLLGLNALPLLDLAAIGLPEMRR